MDETVNLFVLDLAKELEAVLLKAHVDAASFSGRVALHRSQTDEDVVHQWKRSATLILQDDDAKRVIKLELISESLL
jgi:hypothetical protein